VKFLVDAQLPRRLALWLTGAGHDAIHTLALPRGNRTADYDICLTADQEDRIVVTKDDDFIYSFLANGQPRRLLVVNTGNISNNNLLALFEEQLPALLDALSGSRLVELTSETVVSRQ